MVNTSARLVHSRSKKKHKKNRAALKPLGSGFARLPGSGDLFPGEALWTDRSCVKKLRMRHQGSLTGGRRAFVWDRPSAVSSYCSKRSMLAPSTCTIE